MAEILDAQAQIPTGFVPPEGPFHHAVDGELIPEHPLVAARRRPLPPVPILAGTTRDEWRVFDAVLDDDDMTDELLRERVSTRWRATTRIPTRCSSSTGRSSPVTLRSPAGGPWRAHSSPTSTSVRRPSSSCAAHAAHGNPVHRYELQWPSPRPGMGACHDTCLPLVFGTMDTAPVLAGTGADATRMSETVQDAWIAFIRAGRSLDAGLGAWPAYARGATGHDAPGSRSHASSSTTEPAQMAVWEGRYPASG